MQATTGEEQRARTDQTVFHHCLGQQATISHLRCSRFDSRGFVRALNQLQFLNITGAQACAPFLNVHLDDAVSGFEPSD